MGGFDDNGLFYPTVIQDGSTYKMWYWPYTGFLAVGVGYAEAQKVAVEVAPVVAETLPQTGGSNNIIVLFGLATLAVLATGFYLLQRKMAKS